MSIFDFRARRYAGHFTAMAVLCAALSSPLALAQPAAPTVTTNADTKLLKFNWHYVPRANWYELWFKANPGAAWTKYAETPSSRPRTDVGVSAHLLDWQTARYSVRACNPSGCGETAPISVEDLFFDSLGYFKATPSRAGANFGVATSLSEDGRTMAVVANGEPGAGSNDRGSAVVYAFARNGSAWVQQARLVPNPITVRNGETPAISVSGDGNVIALGLLADGPIGPSGTSSTGSVFIFRRTGTAWSQEARIRHRPGIDAFFGFGTQLDEAGKTLLVRSANQRGTSNIFSYAGGAWTRTGEVPGMGAAALCEASTLSGDGLTVARICNYGAGAVSQLQFFSSPAWTLSDTIPLIPANAQNEFVELAVSYDAHAVIASERPVETATQQFPAVHVFDRPRNFHDNLVPRWNCLNQWRSAFGTTIAISRDGGFIAVSDPADLCTERGSVQFAGAKGTTPLGAVYIFGKTAIAGTWPMRRTLKANNAVGGAVRVSGALSFAQNGKTFAVAQISEPSGASGVNGDRNDTSKSFAGAVWLY